jgi:hypothetical protein
MPRVVKFVFWRCVRFLRGHFAFSSHILQHHVILSLEHLINRVEWCAYTRFFKPLTNLRLSSLGLPKSFHQDGNHVTLHDRIQAVWIQCVYLATCNPPVPISTPPLSHRRIFHEHRHPQLSHFRR